MCSRNALHSRRPHLGSPTVTPTSPGPQAKAWSPSFPLFFNSEPTFRQGGETADGLLLHGSPLEDHSGLLPCSPASVLVPYHVFSAPDPTVPLKHGWVGLCLCLHPCVALCLSQKRRQPHPEWIYSGRTPVVFNSLLSVCRWWSHPWGSRKLPPDPQQLLLKPRANGNEWGWLVSLSRVLPPWAVVQIISCTYRPFPLFLPSQPHLLLQAWVCRSLPQGSPQASPSPAGPAPSAQCLGVSLHFLIRLAFAVFLRTSL